MHLRFNVAMHDALGMNEVNGGHEFSRDATGFVLGEMFLAANAIEQFPASQQLHHNVHVELMSNTNDIILPTVVSATRIVLTPGHSKKLFGTRNFFKF